MKKKSKKLLYSVEVCSSAGSWFNFRAGSPTEVRAKLVEIKAALSELGVTLVNDQDISVFKETPIGSSSRGVHVRAECPYCGDWFWHEITDGGSCWLECPGCDERFMLFSIEALKSLGATCSKCPDYLDCLTVPNAK